MAFNKQQNRVGTLFQTPFKRVRVEEENYFKELVCYINTNAKKHNLVKDFKDWKWPSYHSIVENRNTKLLKEDVINFFDDVQNFINYHLEYAKRIDAIENDFQIEEI